MKYKVEVGSFCTRFIKRTITVNAKDEEEASSKAIDEYWKKEQQLPNSVDVGEPHADSIEGVI
jgi:hypothetical protein